MADKRIKQRTKCRKCGKVTVGYVPEIVDGCGNIQYECWDCHDKRSVSNGKDDRT